MIVRIKGTGKAGDMPTTYEADVELESAHNLVKKGYAVIVDDNTSPEAKEGKEEVKDVSKPKTMTKENAVRTDKSAKTKN